MVRLWIGVKPPSTSIHVAFAGKQCDDLFAQGEEWPHAATGAPILTDALASFDCEVEQMMVTTTHAIVIGEIRHVSYGTGGQPLLYLDGSFMTSTEVDVALPGRDASILYD